jgi:superfamily II DNA/RNA helicase
MLILQMLARPAGRNQIGALIVSPTRELAAQIAEEAKALGTFHNFGVQVLKAPPVSVREP